MRALIFVSVLALAGCTAAERPAGQAALTAVPGKAIGDPVSCLDTRRVERVEAVNDYVAFIHMRGKRVYRTDFPGGCQGLKTDSFSHRSTVSKYCRGDIIQLFDRTSGISQQSCVFGDFVPYELPPTEAEG